MCDLSQEALCSEACIAFPTETRVRVKPSKEQMVRCFGYDKTESESDPSYIYRTLLAHPST